MVQGPRSQTSCLAGEVSDTYPLVLLSILTAWIIGTAIPFHPLSSTMYLRVFTATLSIAGCFEQKTIRPVLESVTYPDLRAASHSSSQRFTHLDTSQDVIHVQRLEQGPELKVDLDNTPLEVQCAGHCGFDRDWLIGAYSQRKPIQLSRSRSLVVEHSTDLARDTFSSAGRTSTCRTSCSRHVLLSVLGVSRPLHGIS